VSLSYVDDERDGRGWAFREPRGADPVNGEADVRLWPMLARFDPGYNPLGKISERRLVDFPSLWGYARDLYHLPAFRETTDFGAFARFGSGPPPSFLNDAPWRIKVDPYRADWDEPHDREQPG
jgi:glutathionyl-hydroquinone reductase